jgi:L-arabinose isomerase
MKKVKSRIGLFLFQSQWFKEVGLTRGGSEGAAAKGLGESLEADAAEIARILGQEADVVTTAPVSTPEQACEAALRFVNARVDLVVICPVVWSEDQPLFKALPLLRDMPLVLWCTSPYLRVPSRETLAGYLRNSGIVGAMQFVGALKKWGCSFEFVAGSFQDENAVRKIFTWAEAAAVRRELRETTMGLVASRCDQMVALYTDEISLKKMFGVTLKYGSVAQLEALTRQVAAEEIENFVGCLKSRFPVRGADDESIRESARVSLGARKLTEAMGVAAMTLNEVDEEMHKTFGLRPGFYPWMLSDHKVVLGLEGDYGMTTMMLILAMITGAPVAFEETLSFDKSENIIVFNHIGPQDPDLAQDQHRPALTVDVEYSCSNNRYRGATLEFNARPGRVTFLNQLYTPGGFRMTVAGGESLGGPPRIPGAPHFNVRLDVPLDRFFDQVGRWGVTHHWAFVHGDVVPQIEALAKILSIDLLVVK